MGTVKLSALSLQYYAIVRRWSSDLEFFKIETNFLHRLLNDYFIQLSEHSHVQKLKLCNQRLLKLDEDKNEAEKLLQEQLKQLELIAEGTAPDKPEKLANKQAELEEAMAKLTQEYRDTKIELFMLVETVMMGNKYMPKKHPD